MARWELWRNEDATERAFMRADNVHARTRAIEDGLTLEWECEARGANDAARLRNRFLGWEEYEPMLRPDGKPYPEDEDDGYRPDPPP